jgi:hypothetical protein
MTRGTATHIFNGFLYRDSKGHHASHPSGDRLLDAQIDRAELRARYKTYLTGHYLSLHITVVSVVLAVAGLAAAGLVGRGMGPHYQLLVLWLLWAGSLAATAVAYGGPMVGAFALPAEIPSITGLLLPLLVGVSEFLLFSIQISQVSPVKLDLDRTVNSWLTIMAIFSFTACLSVLRARHHYATEVREKVYSDEVAVMVGERYLPYLNRDARAAGVVTVVAATAAGLRISGSIKWPAFIFPAIITAGLLLGLRGHMEVVQMWRELMPNKLATHHRKPAATNDE